MTEIPPEHAIQFSAFGTLQRLAVENTIAPGRYFRKRRQAVWDEKGSGAPGMDVEQRADGPLDCLEGQVTRAGMRLRVHAAVLVAL